MNQEIEIEYKQLLTQNEFKALLNVFHLTDQDFIRQDNDYFDTPDFNLKAARSALRIRHRREQSMLTLKQETEGGMLETHQLLTQEELIRLKQDGRLPEGDVAAVLKPLDINPHAFQFLGTLTTYRAERGYKAGLLVFDHSVYLGIEDFELEYEVKDPKHGNEAFLQLLHSNHIALTPTKNKIARFFDRKTQLGGL
ncbi:CYTH domain-containing protein [Pullulanibacillus camelliae]|uniref:CYTH domain-containing protein n=1 Tax=Pullulanibacillus camelliae TaxID=1707096 RepID=A0A8J2YLM2_9BACL|nr:CYTH domain-containing protein [Pullulanibacillus camelliae]GGE51300.1 CYTH domain-containing protein [Pullulanibacillus camelliae]